MSPTIGVLDVAAGAGVLAAAALALTTRRRLVAAVAFLVFGTLLALVWALLQAPDVALAEAVLGAGVTGALLIDQGPPPPTGACPRMASAFPARSWPPTFRTPASSTPSESNATVHRGAWAGCWSRCTKRMLGT